MQNLVTIGAWRTSSIGRTLSTPRNDETLSALNFLKRHCATNGPLRGNDDECATLSLLSLSEHSTWPDLLLARPGGKCPGAAEFA